MFRYEHAVGKTAGVHAAVGGDIDGTAVPGLAQDRDIRQGLFLTIGGKYLPFYLKVERFRTLAVRIIVPGGYDIEPGAADIPGKGLGLLDLMFVVFEDDKFPIGGSAGGQTPLYF